MARKPSEFLGEHVRTLRTRKNWTQRDLSARLAELGLHIDPTGVARLEAGERGVSLDEAVAFAAALECSPLALVTPLAHYEDQDVEIAPKLTLPAMDVRRWWRGLKPLRDQDRAFYMNTISDAEALENYEKVLRGMLVSVQQLVDAWVDEDRERGADATDDLNRQLEWLSRAAGWPTDTKDD